MHQVKLKAAVVLLIGTLNVLFCYSAIPDDRIKALPGWSGLLPSAQYSGYIKLDPSNGKQLFYWFVESERDPENDPVVLWLNGGPGCSSLYGYLVELGPFHFARTTEVSKNLTLPTLTRNPYAWSRIANMIFLESPAGVGFSYSTNPRVDYVTNDEQTATDNYNFLVQFFSYYPEFKRNDFYITGESYAGIYIPMLVNTIRVMNGRVPLDQHINLKGFMVGNGCVGNMVGGCGPISGLNIQAEFYHGHALISNALYDRIMETCDFEQPSLTQQCCGSLKEMAHIVGKIYVYNIYEPCQNSKNSKQSYHGQSREDRARNPLKMLFYSTAQAQYSAPWIQSQVYNGPDDFYCITDVLLERYLNNPLVRAAIHVNDEPGHWVQCAPKVHLLYHRNIASLIPIYPTLIQQYRTVIFNGDVDSCVPFIGNEEWTSSLGFKIKEGWRPWLVDDQVAGYVTQYDVNDFTFLTVKGAGHMVPKFKPKQAYAMFERFINQQPF